MQFKTTAVAVALAATQAQATFTPQGLANVFTELTDTAADIIKIGSTAEPITIITSFPRLLADFKDIGLAIVEAETGLDGLKKDDFKKSDQNEVCEALENFVDKAEEAADALIGENSIIGRTPIVNLVGVALGTVRDGLASFSRSVLDVVPTCEDKIEKKLSTFNNTLEDGFTRYEVTFDTNSQFQ